MDSNNRPRRWTRRVIALPVAAGLLIGSLPARAADQISRARTHTHSGAAPAVTFSRAGISGPYTQ